MFSLLCGVCAWTLFLELEYAPQGWCGIGLRADTGLFPPMQYVRVEADLNSALTAVNPIPPHARQFVLLKQWEQSCCIIPLNVM